MNKAYPGVGSTVHEFLGPGAVYFNYGLSSETRVGLTKGGSEFNDNAEFREREADGDYAPVKGHRQITKFTPQLSINALRLSTSNLLKFYAGMQADNTTTAGKSKIYRTLDLSSSYIDNVAFVGKNKEDKNIIVVVKNALGDGPINIPTTDKENEIVINPQFTGHIDDTFDPDDKTTYPYYIEKDTSQVTFTVDDGTDPIEGAVIIFDAQYAATAADGTAIFTSDKSTSALSYTISKDGYTDISGTLVVDDDTEAVTVHMTAV